MRRAKIICTLGPASATPERIGALIDEGMDAARLNFSHGDHDFHAGIAARVRAEAARRGKAVAVLMDLQGPKIRIGRFALGEVELEPGADFMITTEECLGDGEHASTTYEGLPGDVKPGNILLLDDGMLQLEVDRVEGREVYTRVLIGGTLKDNKGLNLPGVNVSAPALTEKDRADLAFGIALGVDFVALSFVRSADDLGEARRLIAAAGNGKKVPLIAKIERPEAVERLDEIVDAADGIMVARGDLGVELGPEKVPLIQKRCIDAANARGKLVIVATQMLESMISSPRPTRAEASDVANAVLDQADALMLSGETASGRYPLLAVRTMSQIIREIEASPRFRHLTVQTPALDLPISTAAVAHAAAVVAKQLNIPAIAVVSGAGGAARLLSEYRPEARIFAFSDRPSTVRQLALYWGVTPAAAPTAGSTDEMLERVGEALKAAGHVVAGESVVITMAVPLGSGEKTNLLKVHRVR
ncbi:MAG: pyruvate kinase [Myxococcales bacterium]|nr:pyruvate kinase [Myxococcales bacterium]